VVQNRAKMGHVGLNEEKGSHLMKILRGNTLGIASFK
jgi:hypothetical protein